jgi:hypothetical protein
MAMQGLVITRRVHVGDDEDSLFTHKHHITSQTPSIISKVVAINNFEKLVPWSC